MRRAVGVALVLLLAAAGGALAQGSIFAVRGIGFPGRAYGPRSRALGGGFSAIDPLAALNPATIGDLATVTVLATSGTTMRGYTFGADTVTGLHETRFPFAIAGGPIPGTALTIAVSFASYLDRTFDLSANDSILVRGKRIGVSDRIASDGAVADVRGALAWSDPSHSVSLGVGVHLLSGSARLAATRQFGDSAYQAYNEQGEEELGSAGVSVGALVRVGSALRLSAAARADNQLTITIDSVQVAQVHLPMRFTGGMLFAPVPTVRWAATVSWQNWSRARADGITAGGAVFDTWELGTGVELGGRIDQPSKLPLRFGVRYAQLPFSPTADQPHEFVFSAGTGLSFAAARGQIDATIERALRDGAGVSERAWQLAFSITVRP
jgi:hypothetical protein